MPGTDDEDRSSGSISLAFRTAFWGVCRGQGKEQRTIPNGARYTIVLHNISTYFFIFHIVKNDVHITSTLSRCI